MIYDYAFVKKPNPIAIICDTPSEIQSLRSARLHIATTEKVPHSAVFRIIRLLISYLENKFFPNRDLFSILDSSRIISTYSKFPAEYISKAQYMPVPIFQVISKASATAKTKLTVFFINIPPLNFLGSVVIVYIEIIELSIDRKVRFSIASLYNLHYYNMCEI